MDKHNFIYEDPEKINRCNDNIQQPAHSGMNKAPQGPTMHSFKTVLQNHPRTPSEDAVKLVQVVNKVQNDDRVTEGYKVTPQLMFHNSDIGNMQTSCSTEMVSRRIVAAEFSLTNTASEGKQTPMYGKNITEAFHTDRAGVSEQPSATGQVMGSGQVTETHNKGSFFVGDQNKDKQKTAVYTDESSKARVKLRITNAGLTHSMPLLSQQVFEVQNSSASVQTCTEAENIDTDPSSCCIQQDTETINSFSTKTNTNFEPVILNVYGGYHEMESDDINENQDLTSLEPTSESHTSEDTTTRNTNAGSIKAAEFVSKSASELLQGMIQYAVSTSQNSKDASSKGISIKIKKSKTHLGTKLSLGNHPLVHTQIPVGRDQGHNSVRQVNSLVEKVSPSTETVWSTKSKMLSRVADSGLLHVPMRAPQSAGFRSSAVGVTELPISSDLVPDISSHVLPNVLASPTQTTLLPTTYSCVYVHGHNNGNQNKVAFLVPQASLKSDLNYLANLTSAVLSKEPATEPQTAVTSALSSSVASPTEISKNTRNLSFEDRISKLVTDTVSSFYLQGKDVKDSGLLKIQAPRNEESSPYTVYCSVCSEGYHDEDGLNFHLNRTVFDLLFYCSHCKRRHTFYNKCSLWLHLRKEKSNFLNYNNIVWLKPYEFDAEDGCENQISEAADKASPEISGVEHSNSDVCRGDKMPASTTAPVEQVTQTKSACTTTVSLSSRKRKYVSKISTCPICLKYFVDLSAHLCPTTARTLPCSSCDMFLPSICALEAHMKIHQGVAKDICCAECGEKDFKVAPGDDDMRCVFDHVDVCKHFNRILGMQCFCKQEFHNVDRLTEHFMEHHFRIIFKCPFCVLAFTQHDNFAQHADKIHHVKEMNIRASVLCLFCQHVLKSYAEVKVHLDQYVEHFKLEAKFKWKCFICSKSFTDKAELNKHTQFDHPHKSKRCTICYSLFWSRKSLVEHIVEKKCLRSLAKNFNHCIDMQAEEPKKSSQSVHLMKMLGASTANHDVDKTQRQLNCAPVVSKNPSLIKKNPLLVRIGPKVISKSSQSVVSKSSQSAVSKSSQSVVSKSSQSAVSKSSQSVVSKSSQSVVSNSSQSVVSKSSQSAVSKSSQSVVSKSSHSVVSKSSQLVVSKSSQSVATVQIPQSVTLQKETPPEVLSTGNKLATQPYKIIITSKGDSARCRTSITVSQCVVCKQLLESTKMTEHLKYHQSQGVIICFRCSKRDFATIEEARNHSDQCSGSVSKQPAKQAELMSDNSKGDGETPEANKGSMESSGEPPVQERMETDEKNEENQTLSVFPCLLCGLAFQSLSAREEHVSRTHDGIRVVYHCGLCRKKGTSKLFSRKELVSRHITKKHRIVDMDTVDRLIRAEEQNASSGQKLQVSKSAEDVPAPKRLRLAAEGDYLCGKCGFSSAGSQEFSQHIASHNSSKEPQCPECGLCFTVFAALKKHLLAVHKIHAVDDYLKTNNVTEPDSDVEFDDFPEIHPYYKPQPKLLDSVREKSSPSPRAASSNSHECNVCYRAFDDEANLKTHMRNHGMAFIRSKRHKV